MGDSVTQLPHDIAASWDIFGTLLTPPIIVIYGLVGSFFQSMQPKSVLSMEKV
jgi:hypothetical protein